MGFYSIYKIIKDVIRTLFGTKFLKIFIILIISLIILFFLNEKGVFAVSPTLLTYNQETHNITYNNQNYKINDDIFTMPYLLFFEEPGQNSHVLTIAASSQPFYFAPSGDDYYNIRNSVNTTFYWETFDYRYPSILQGLTTKTLSNYSDSSSDTGLYVGGFNLTSNTILFLNFDIYNFNNQQELLFSSNAIPQYTAPSLSNSISDLENLNFTNFIINANDFTDEIENNDGTLFMLFYNRSLTNSQNTDGLYPIKEKAFTKGSIFTDVENSTSNNMVFSYPIFMSGVYFNIGSTYEIRFAKKVYNSEYNRMVYQYLGEPIQFTISSNVTQDYINQLNQQTATSTDNDNTQELQNSIENQTQSIDNINNSITDSNIDTSSIDLPTDNTQDPTQSGVDNIFQTIYNSFTSGTPQDIVFPIPFSNNNLVIQANYVSNMLGSSQAGSVIISLIQAYYWYLISRFIITDIMRKVRKIKQGNFENIQNSNIKEDML